MQYSLSYEYSLFLLPLSTENFVHEGGRNCVRLGQTCVEAVQTTVRTGGAVHYSLSYEYFVVFTPFEYRNKNFLIWVGDAFARAFVQDVHTDGLLMMSQK